MTRYAIPLVFVLGLGACQCNEDPEDTEQPEGDTDTDTDTDSDTDADTDTDTDTDTDCVITVVETTPEDEASGWYYKNSLEVLFSEAASSQAGFLLTDELGETVEVEVSWESSDFLAVIDPVPDLAASSGYLLTTDVCGENTEVAFSTDVYGDDLDDGSSALEHNTYILELSEMSYTKPEGFEILFAFKSISPLLLGVAQADAETLTFYVIEGKYEGDGEYIVKREDPSSWWLEPADFGSQPYFDSDFGSISFDFQGTELPIRDFHLEGTFAPDGSSIGGLEVSGVADTRELSDEFWGNEEAVCKMLSGMGITCIECEDGKELCLELLVEDAIAPIQEGLDVIPKE